MSETESETKRKATVRNKVPPHIYKLWHCDGACAKITIKKSPLQTRAHSLKVLASQYTAQYQMVQCFPYGRDTH